MDLQHLSEQLNDYADKNQDRDFLAYPNYTNQLEIMTTYRKYPLDSSSEERKIIKFSEELLVQYQKDTGPEFIKVLWGRTFNFSWLVDDKGNVVDTKHYYDFDGNFS